MGLFYDSCEMRRRKSSDSQRDVTAAVRHRTKRPSRGLWTDRRQAIRSTSSKIMSGNDTERRMRALAHMLSNRVDELARLRMRDRRGTASAWRHPCGGAGCPDPNGRISDPRSTAAQFPSRPLPPAPGLRPHARDMAIRARRRARSIGGRAECGKLTRRCRPFSGLGPCSSRSHRCEPMKPAPPATKMRCSFNMMLDSPGAVVAWLFPGYTSCARLPPPANRSSMPGQLTAGRRWARR